MAFSRKHALTMTAPDDPTFENNPSDWNAAHALSGADVGGIPYCPTATTETTSSGFTFNRATGEGLQIAAGTATTNVQALSVAQTWNAAGVAFTGIKAVFTATAQANDSNYLDLQDETGTVFRVRRNSSSTGNTQVYLATRNASQFCYLDSRFTGNAAAGFNTSPALVSNGILGIAPAANSYLSIDTSTSTAATSRTVGLVSIVDRWNASGVSFVAIDLNVTNTASAATSDLQRWRVGGTALAAINKAGNMDAVSYSVGGAAGASFGPGAVTSITVVNGIVTAIS